MAFVTISSNEIEVGDALKAELFVKIKANEDDHETRINTVESTVKKIDIFKYMVVNSASFSTATGLDYYQAVDNFTVTKAAIRIFEETGYTGFLEIDIKKSTTTLASGAFSTIFSTKPKIDYSTSTDYMESSNQVMTAAASVSVGNYLRFDITITPSPITPKFMIIVYGE